MKNTETKNTKNTKMLEDCGGLKPLVLVKPPKKTAKKTTKKSK